MNERKSNNFDYDVAISFAGEDRGVAEQIANRLIEDAVRVFYDRYEETDLWGKDLYPHLADVYSNKARFCLVLISVHYSKKLWPRHELQNAFARAFQESEEYILPLRLDDTELPGIRPTIGYQDLRHSSPEKIAELIKKKLGKAKPERSKRQGKGDSESHSRKSDIPLPPIKRQFSDRDRATFLRDSFERIITYFKDGLQALERHDREISTEVNEITKQKYVFEVYRAGELKNSCKIWIGSLGSQKNVSYQEGDVAPHDDSSVNGWIHVESDDRQMYLTGLIGEIGRGSHDSKLSVEDAAKMLWERFIRPLTC